MAQTVLRGARVPVTADQAGAQIRRGLGSITRDSFFQYTQLVTFDATGVNTLTPVIQIQMDAHFLCVMSMYSNGAVFAAGGALPPTILFGGALVQLQDVSAQRFLQSAQVPIDTLFGTAQRPYIWPFTHAFRAGGGIGINITGSNVSMAAASVRLVFSGFKVPIGAVPELDRPGA